MIDLHLHTLCSDGRDSPEAVVSRAVSLGLEAIAVTDHDTMAGSLRAIEAAGTDLRVVPGVELSAIEGKTPIHFLGYGVDATCAPFAALLESIREERRARAEEIILRLHTLNVPLSMAAVERIADGAPITRTHLAEAMVAGGFAATYTDAFARYLSTGCPAFIPQGHLRPEAAIARIHDAGGAAVLAHPGLTRRDELIAGMVRNGLDGIEILHPNHTPAIVRYYQGLAQKHGLVVTGGSDAHGAGRGGDLMGAVCAPTWMLHHLDRVLEDRRSEAAGKPLEHTLSTVP